MSKKHNNSEKIDLVRKILDNPNDISLSIKDKHIETLRIRLKKQSGHQEIKYDYDKTKDMILKPSVNIHHIYHEKPPSFSPNKPKERDKFPQKLIQPKENDFFNEEEDLFEIEHVSEYDLPDFIEVKAEDQFLVKQKEKLISLSFESQQSINQLPEWELAKEEGLNGESKEKKSQKSVSKEASFDDKETQEIASFETEQQMKEDIPIWKSVSESNIAEKKSHKRKPLLKRITRDKTSKDKNKIEPTFFIIDSKPSIEQQDQKNREKFFQYKDYILYQKEIDLGNNIKRVIHFFSKDKPDDSNPSTLPKNYEVKINKKTGVPYIRKKQN